MLTLLDSLTVSVVCWLPCGEPSYLHGKYIELSTFRVPHYHKGDVFVTEGLAASEYSCYPAHSIVAIGILIVASTVRASSASLCSINQLSRSASCVGEHKEDQCKLCPMALSRECGSVVGPSGG